MYAWQIRSQILNLGQNILYIQIKMSGLKSDNRKYPSAHCETGHLIIVFHYQWGLSHCWAIWPLYRFKTWYNRLRSTICKYGLDHMSGLPCQVFIIYCSFLLCYAMTSYLDDKDSDSSNSDYQSSTPKGHLAR